jgi:hypothetical protein
MMAGPDIVALLLPPDDREAVLGDLEEQKQPGWLRIFAVLDLVVRQQAEYWRNWRAWLVGGTVVAATFLLLGVSFQLSLDFRDLIHGGGFGTALLCEAALTIAWAGTGGFVIGALSRRTGWICPLLFIFPCFSCLTEFPGPVLSSLCLLLFVPPAIVSAIAGRRWMGAGSAPSLASSVALVCATVGLMLLWHRMPVEDWLLLLPALHLAWNALKADELGQRGRS